MFYGLWLVRDIIKWNHVNDRTTNSTLVCHASALCTRLIPNAFSKLGEHIVVQGRRKSLIEGLISYLLQSKQVLPVGGLVEGRSQRVFRKLTRNYRPGHSSKWKWRRGYFFYLMRIEKLTAQTIFGPLPPPQQPTSS